MDFLDDQAAKFILLDKALTAKLNKLSTDKLAENRKRLLHHADRLEKQAAWIRERVAEPVVTTAATSGTQEE